MCVGGGCGGEVCVCNCSYVCITCSIAILLRYVAMALVLCDFDQIHVISEWSDGGITKMTLNTGDKTLHTSEYI